MRFLTYNIRHGQGEDGWVSNERIAAAVRAARPDITGMNEVWRLGTFFDQPDDLSHRLAVASAFERNTGRFIEQGNLILTRGTIGSVTNLDLPSRLEHRGCLVAEIKVDGDPVTFASTHLALHRATRALQVAALVELLPRDRPLVLAGDMNCGEDELGGLREILTLATAPKSYPAFHPMKALDHIAYSRHFRLVSIEAQRSHASDHCPVVAELAFV